MPLGGDVGAGLVSPWSGGPTRSELGRRFCFPGPSCLICQVFEAVGALLRGNELYTDWAETLPAVGHAIVGTFGDALQIFLYIRRNAQPGGRSFVAALSSGNDPSQRLQQALNHIGVDDLLAKLD